MTLTLTTFLLARIAEDEALARAASPSPWSYGDVASVAGGMIYDKARTIASLVYEQPTDHDGSIVRHMLAPEADANGAHIARHDPARVLAECEAKRRLLNLWAAQDEYGERADQGEARAFIALPYADHPDFDESWRP